jgi:hypothetical protein
VSPTKEFTVPVPVPATAKRPTSQKQKAMQLFALHKSTSFSGRPCYIRPAKNFISANLRSLKSNQVKQPGKEIKYITVKNTD